MVEEAQRNLWLLMLSMSQKLDSLGVEVELVVVVVLVVEVVVDGGGDGGGD